MNLDDIILLRSWIYHVDWAELDSQLSDDRVSARQRIKALRRELAVTARFYGTPEEAECWLGDRSLSEAWQQRALTALNQFSALPCPVPALDHAVSQWFPLNVCEALPLGVNTLSELIDHLEALFAQDGACPDRLKPHLNTLTRFFDSHASPLGYQLNQKPQPPALPVPLAQVAPLERVFIPYELNGEHGSNRSRELCRIDANHDLAAINSWLSLKDGNALTYQAYKKELERLLLWAVLERGKALSSLNTDDCKAYVHFLKTLTTEQTQWVTTEPANKNYGKWKPFVYRPKTRSEAASTPDLTHSPPPVLSPKSINFAKTVISSCMTWLVKQQYLQHNNFEDIPSIKFAQTRVQTQNRAFTLKQMQLILGFAQTLSQQQNLDYLAHRRLVFILKLAFHTGLRIHELAAASFGDIECLEGEPVDHYFLNVLGKNSKQRKTSLPAILIDELQAYLKARGLPTHLDFLPDQAPLIPRLRDKTGRKHLSPAGLHKIVSAFFDTMLMHLEVDEQADKRLVNKLRQASTHWLRHSYGSYLANDKQVPLPYIRDELGHANISTTSLYLNTDEKQRQQVVSEAFSEV